MHEQSPCVRCWSECASSYMRPFWRPPPFCLILNPLFSVLPAAGLQGQSRPQADAGFSTSNPKEVMLRDWIRMRCGRIVAERHPSMCDHTPMPLNSSQTSTCYLFQTLHQHSLAFISLNPTCLFRIFHRCTNMLSQSSTGFPSLPILWFIMAVKICERRIHLVANSRLVRLPESM